MSDTANPASAGVAASSDEPLLAVENLKKHFPVNSGVFGSLKLDTDNRPLPFALDDSSVKAVDGVSFDLQPGETFGIVGESGCGKSTLARTILGLEESTEGEIRFDGTPTEHLDESEFRKRAQMVFQDPQSSLNGRRKVGHIIADPLEGAGWPEEKRRERALELLEDVGLKREYYGRYPHEFSGGQRQRINLARALSINPDLVVADEPVSGLDVSVQAQILNLMEELQDEYGLTYLFISHDLSVVRYIADRVAVMYVGDFVEVAPAAELFAQQHHPYARALLSAVPNPDPDTPGVHSAIQGDVPSASEPPRGCKFHTRCPEFIAPDGFSDDAYEEYERLLSAVRSRELDPDLSADELFDSFVAESGIPAQAQSAVKEASEAISDGEWNAAARTLAEYESVCQANPPTLDSIPQSSRSVACHLPIEEMTDG